LEGRSRKEKKMAEKEKNLENRGEGEVKKSSAISGKRSFI